MTNSPAIDSPATDDYYVKLFVDHPEWSAPEPNEDESARWRKISALLETIVARQPAGSSTMRPRLLEVGCGRGWLTKLASRFGECEGVEPVAPVVAQARRLFPELNFTVGTAETILASPDFQPYDLVLTSEVIEHVPREAQPEFVRKLARLLKPGGHIILTTPRGEALQEWTRLAGDPAQPVEEWIREPQLRQLFLREHFTVVAHERVLFDLATRRYLTGREMENFDDLLAIYQVWAFQLPENPAAVPLIPAALPGKALAGFHRACFAAAGRALRELPEHPVLLTARASALLDLDDAPSARQLLTWVVALHPDHLPARRLFAEALRRLGLASQAGTQIECAERLEAAASESSQPKSFSFVNHLRDGKLIEGAPPQLEIRNATINQKTGPCIYLHPPAKLRFEMPINAPGRFVTAIAIQPEAWGQPTAGGCDFFLHLDGREVFRKSINPRQFSAHRCWHEIEIDVPAAPGPFHEFIFRTHAVGSPPDFRWALWREPVFRPLPS